MRTPHSTSVLRRLIQGILAVLLLSTAVAMSGCGGNAHLQQQASQSKSQLDRLLHYAQGIGVPAPLLNPILKQEQQLSSTAAPFTLFNDQSANNYYTTLATNYARLETLVQAAITSGTNDTKAQAQHNIQQFQATLSQRHSQGLPVENFAQQFTQDQALLATAQYPKDYALISSKAQASMQALDLMQMAARQLSSLKNSIAQMQDSHIDVTVMRTQYQSDQQAFNSATRSLDLQRLSAVIDAQYQQAVVNSAQVLPYVTAAKLSEFETQLNQLKVYGLDARAYQQKFAVDRALMQKAANLQDYLVFSKQVDADIASVHAGLVQGEATYLVKEFHQEVDAWGKANPYHDTFDGQSYPLDDAYMDPGIGSDLDRGLSSASTPEDFQSTIDEANNALFNLNMLEADYSDPTPYDQVHATDLQMINNYKLQKGQLLMVSLVEQAMRVYQNGKLVRAFQVTTGRMELPAVPGVWSVLDRESPTTFKSVEPEGSPYWYPDTPIHYAILYHQGGYFVHDSWWRADYGLGTQFPHADSGGDTQFSGNGSHGCVNMQEDQAQWVYNNTDWNTLIVVY